jgi:hypothetical protein
MPSHGHAATPLPDTPFAGESPDRTGREKTEFMRTGLPDGLTARSFFLLLPARPFNSLSRGAHARIVLSSALLF